MPAGDPFVRMVTQMALRMHAAFGPHISLMIPEAPHSLHFVPLVFIKPITFKGVPLLIWPLGGTPHFLNNAANDG